jgi:hypothetical protein
MVLSALVATLVRAQVSDETTRGHDRFLAALQEESSSSDPAEESPTPRPKSSKPKSKKTPSPTPHKSPTPKPKKKKKPAGDEDETPAPPKAKKALTPNKTSPESDETPTKKKAKGSKQATPTKKKGTVKEKTSPKPAVRAKEEEPAASPLPSETPAARAATPNSRGVAGPTPAAPPSPASSAQMDTSSEEPAELTIEKTGYEKKPGFWYRFFHGDGSSRSSGSGAGYRYLTRAVRAEIDRAPADRRNPRWEFIVVHNSGTRQGNARVFDYYHKHVRHMQNGLAYHFVIGNGTSTGNGQIEIGDRWRRQINGGHVHSDHLNNIALGICLVGDFNRSQPTPAQLQSCEELIRYLRQRCGKIGNHYMVVKPHREMNPPRWATDCPGDAFPYSWFRRFQE